MENEKDGQSPFKDRLRVIMSKFGTKSKAEFYRRTKVDPAQFYRIWAGTHKPGLGFLDRLSIAFPDLNMGWFMTGVGEPFIFQLNEKEKTIIQNYRDIEDDKRIGFEVQCSLYGKEEEERRKLNQNIGENISNADLNRGTKQMKLELSHMHQKRTVLNKSLKGDSNSFLVNIHGRKDITNKAETIDNDIHHFITMDSPLFKKMLKIKNED
jgi:hypothetical protein